MLKEFEINGTKLGVNLPPYIVAEVSANHNLKLISLVLAL